MLSSKTQLAIINQPGLRMRVERENQREINPLDKQTPFTHD